MSMIHSCIKSVQRYFSNTHDEKKLALKISGASFFVLIGILWSILSTSYLYQRDHIYREFHDEIAVFEWGHIGRNIREAFHGNSGNLTMPMMSPRQWEKEFRGPRDILIFDKDHRSIKNDYLDLNDQEITLLYGVDNIHQSSLEINERYYLIYKKEFPTFTIFFTRDLTQMIDFHIWLLILASLWSMIGLMIIYTLSKYLARMVIAPIREHNSSLEAYSHNVAHELKTPLAVMQSNLELLAMTQPNILIESSHEEIHAMERTIDTLLFMANPEKRFTEKEKIDIVEITQHVIESYKEDKLEFHSNRKRILLEGNMELYKRILTNLIENAIKYRSDGPITIILTAKTLKITNAIDHDIEALKLARFTEKFYQEDTSRSSGGQWLGLSLVKNIVDIFKWKLHIESNKGQFFVEILFD